MNILVSYNWLKDYVETKDSPYQLARKLSLCGPSVEKVIEKKFDLKNVVVGEILEIKKHPNADNLSLVKVDIGKKKIEIVCRASNIKVGQKVPVALEGAILPGGFKIEKRKVRGIESRGMLCAQDELGIGGDHNGIFILPKELKIGQDLTKALDLNDYIFDTEITTNRPDVLSIIGFAREVSAITGGKLLIGKNPPNPSRIKHGTSFYKRGMENNKKSDILQIQVQDKKNCPRYMAIVLDNIKVKSSPWWMQKRLLSYGVRPINNIVDITNFVMLEYGQPMHTFDYDKISGKKIIIRRAKNNEKIIALDDNEYKLNSEMLIIADAKEAIAVAGIMGGKFSAVDSKTKRIVLEAANFNEISIRKTARALNLYSESSTRFEKGLSDQLPLPAMMRAVELVQNLTEANIVSSLIDKGIKKYQQTKIKLSKKNVELFLGVKISSQKIIKILNSLGFEVRSKENWEFIVNVPFWRDKDVGIEVDLIEEIARIYGYYKLPIELPTGKIPQKEKNWQLYWENKTKEILSGAGMTEVYSYSFISKEFLEKAGIDSKKCLKLLNPLNVDLEYMRPSLIHSLLQVIFQNQKIKDKFEIFELANIYLSKGFNKLPDEKLALCGAIVQGLIKKQKLFYKIKGIVELLFEKIGIDVLTVSYKPLTVGRFWHSTKAAKILIKNQQVGIIGEIHPEILAKFDIDMPVAMFDFDFSRLIKQATTRKTYQPIIKFPPVKLDLAIVIDKKILWNDIQKLIYQTGENFVKRVELFDVYEGRGVSINKKSLAFHITYQSADQTLEDKEVNKIQEKITKVLEKKFEAEVRGVV